jgi:hypothetical protein
LSPRTLEILRIDGSGGARFGSVERGKKCRFGRFGGISQIVMPNLIRHPAIVLTGLGMRESSRTIFPVIPANAGIQFSRRRLDPRFRGDDGLCFHTLFLEDIRRALVPREQVGTVGRLDKPLQRTDAGEQADEIILAAEREHRVDQIVADTRFLLLDLEAVGAEVHKLLKCGNSRITSFSIKLRLFEILNVERVVHNKFELLLI